MLAPCLLGCSRPARQLAAPAGLPRQHCLHLWPCLVFTAAHPCATQTHASAVVKCRVLGADPSRKGLKLSLVSKKKAAAGGEGKEAPTAAAGGEGEGAAGGKARPGKAAAALGTDAEAALGAFQPGDVVRGTVVALHSKEVRPRGRKEGCAGQAGAVTCAELARPPNGRPIRAVLPACSLLDACAAALFLSFGQPARTIASQPVYLVPCLMPRWTASKCPPTLSCRRCPRAPPAQPPLGWAAWRWLTWQTTPPRRRRWLRCSSPARSWARCWCCSDSRCGAGGGFGCSLDRAGEEEAACCNWSGKGLGAATLWAASGPSQCPPMPPCLALWRCVHPLSILSAHLAVLQGVKQLRVTRKASLLSAAAAGLLPASLERVAEGSVLAGYVASVTRDAVFVR